MLNFSDDTCHIKQNLAGIPLTETSPSLKPLIAFKQSYPIERLWVGLHLALLIATSCLANWPPDKQSVDTKLQKLESSASKHRFVSAPFTPETPTAWTEPQVNSHEDSDVPCQVIDPGISEVWEISSRHMADRFGCINPLNPGLRAKRYTPAGWQPQALDDALISDDRLVIVYVHGNFMETNNALDRALILNKYLSQRSQIPYRLLMLSWPSAREPHPLRDVYENAQSAESQALFVGWLLDKLHDHPNVSLLGFSFGARAVTGGLHLNAGGEIPGFQYTRLSAGPEAPDKYRVALVAPALDRDWLAPTGKHAQALNHVSGLVNLYNSRDPILRRFRFIDRLSRPVAAGFAGFIGLQGLEGVSNPRATGPLATTSKIRQFDCGSGIGTTHSEKSYYAQCPYFNVVIDHLLGQETNAKPVESTVSF